MYAIALIAVWIMLSVSIVVLGRMLDSKVITGIGVTMALMATCIEGF